MVKCKDCGNLHISPYASIACCIDDVVVDVNEDRTCYYFKNKE